MIGHKRRQLAGAFGALGMAALALRIRSRVRKDIRILCYHRVVDAGRAYDVANVSANPEEFEEQVKYFKKHYDLIRFSDLCEIENGKIPCPDRPLLISFDDGYKDNYEHAYPILKSNGVSGAFFIVTSYVGRKELFWFERVGFLLRNTCETQLTMRDGTVLAIPAEDRDQVLKELLFKLKSLSDGDRVEELDRLENLIESGDEIRIDEINLPMNWTELEEMAANGMEILSHTHEHSILSRLETSDDIRREVETAKRIIEQRLDSRCRVIAYPVGKWFAYDARVLSAVDQVGYDLGCIYESGTNSYPIQNKFELKRIPVNPGVSIRALASVIAMPEIFSY